VKNHIYNNKNGFLFHRAIKKYGIENFELIYVAYCSKLTIDREEQIQIKTFSSLQPKGYNILPGGGVSRWWEVATEKEKRDLGRKISEANKGRKISEETKKKISEVQKGRKQSPEAIENRRKSLTGRIVSKEGKEKMTIQNRQSVSEESKDNIKQILYLLDQGLKGTEIAIIVGCTPEYVYKIKLGQRGSSVTGTINNTKTREQTGAKRNSPEAKERLQKIIELSKQNLNGAEIARQVGCSKTYVCKILNDK